MIIVASSLSLLAIVAGMFLYAKTIKDNLNQFFKIAAYFIIIVGFINLFVGSAFIMMEKIYKHHQKMEKGNYGHHGKKMKKHKYKQMSYEGMSDRNCDYKTKSMCCDEMGMMGGKNCGMGMMDKEGCMKECMMMKNDSMIIMKKHRMK